MSLFIIRITGFYTDTCNPNSSFATEDICQLLNHQRISISYHNNVGWINCVIVNVLEKQLTVKSKLWYSKYAISFNFLSISLFQSNILFQHWLNIFSLQLSEKLCPQRFINHYRNGKCKYITYIHSKFVNYWVMAKHRTPNTPKNVLWENPDGSPKGHCSTTAEAISQCLFVSFRDLITRRPAAQYNEAWKGNCNALLLRLGLPAS